MDNKKVRRILICTDSECICKNSKKILEELKDELKENQFVIKDFCCIGACGLAPVAMVGDKVIGRVTKQKILDYLKNEHNR